MTHKFGALAAVLLTAACAVPVTPEGAAVRLVHSQPLVKNCAFVGAVSSSSTLGGVAMNQGAANATAALRNAGAEAGGDTVLVAYINNGYAGTQAAGEAYRCAGTEAKYGD
jgi:hypothetical protein